MCGIIQGGDLMMYSFHTENNDFFVSNLNLFFFFFFFYPNKEDTSAWAIHTT